MTKIHPKAIVDKKAEIADDVEIGPYTIIGPNVKIGSKTKIYDNVVIEGETTIGEGNEIYGYTTIGVPSQHRAYLKTSGKVTIGKNNIIREHVTIHVGTPVGLDNTIIGDNNLLMVNTHIAHDCIVGNNCIFSNCASLAGHVVVGDFAILAGMCAVHQFCRIGRYAMVGGMTFVSQDLIPCGMATGNRGQLSGLNLVGLKRRNFTVEEISMLRKAYRSLFANEGILAERVVAAKEQYKESVAVQEIVQFMENPSRHGILLPKTETVNSI